MRQISAVTLSIPEGFGARSTSHRVEKHPPFYSVSASPSSLRSVLQAFRLCRTAVDDRSSDILKMAAFAKQLYEMRPSSTKLQLINVPFHSSHSVFQRVCVSVCVHTMHACRHDTFMVVFVIPWIYYMLVYRRRNDSTSRKALSWVNLQFSIWEI